MFTASTDKTLGIWDYETGSRIKKLKGHSSFVNSCFPSRRGPQYIVSGADDCTVKVNRAIHCMYMYVTSIKILFVLNIIIIHTCLYVY